MKYTINSGIYAVDLQGTNNAEFIGIHPSLILKSIKNEEMYYVIPLTSYTKEKWNKYRKLLCCRIVSINSIARIDKMQIIHKSKMPRRWFEGETLLVPTPNEILTVYNRAMEYLELSVKKSLEEYNKFYKNYENVSHLSFEDVKRILWSILGKNNLEITYDKTKNILITKINKTEKGILTLINWYDSIELTEEHK